MMQDHDIIATLQPDGRYTLRRYQSADGALLAIDGYEGTFTEGEMREKLEELRPSGDPYIQTAPNTLYYVQPPIG